MTDPRIARTIELMRLPKAELVRRVRLRWVDGSLPPERWTKEELAADIADHEEFHDQYDAYGRVVLVNRRPVDGSRPHCGGVGCTGHDGPALPWESVRDRYRSKGPCISAHTGIPGPIGEAGRPAGGMSFRIDAIPMPPDRRISSGVRSDAPDDLAVWATQLAAHCRIERPEYRGHPIRVMIWPTRDGEHYRDDPPPSPVSRSWFYREDTPDSAGHDCQRGGCV